MVDIFKRIITVWSDCMVKQMTDKQWGHMRPAGCQFDMPNVVDGNARKIETFFLSNCKKCINEKSNINFFFCTFYRWSEVSRLIQRISLLVSKFIKLQIKTILRKVFGGDILGYGKDTAFITFICPYLFVVAMTL